MTKEELKVLVEDLRIKANEEDEANEKIITDKLQSYTDKKIRARISFGYYNDVTATIEFWNEKENDWDFGSTINLYYYGVGSRERRGREAIEISIGSIGTHSKKYIYQIARVKLLSNLWDDIDNLTEVLDNLKHTMSTVFREKYDELADIEYEEKRKETNQIKNEIKTKLVSGAELQYKGRKIKITRLTPKRIYYVTWCSYVKLNSETNEYDETWQYNHYEQFKPTDDMISDIYWDKIDNQNKIKFLNEEA